MLKPTKFFKQKDRFMDLSVPFGFPQQAHQKSEKNRLPTRFWNPQQMWLPLKPTAPRAARQVAVGQNPIPLSEHPTPH